MLQYVYHVSQILSFHMVAAQYVIRRVNLASLLQIQLYVPIVNQDHIWVVENVYKVALKTVLNAKVKINVLDVLQDILYQLKIQGLYASLVLLLVEHVLKARLQPVYHVELDYFFKKVNVLIVQKIVIIVRLIILVQNAHKDTIKQINRFVPQIVSFHVLLVQLPIQQNAIAVLQAILLTILFKNVLQILTVVELNVLFVQEVTFYKIQLARNAM